MKDATRSKLTNLVVGLQWSTNAVVLMAMMMLLLGVKAPDWLATVATVWVIAVGCPALVGAMALTFALNDNRRWWAVAVSMLILASGVLYLHHKVESDRANSAQAVIEGVEKSPEYVALKARLDAESTSLATLAPQSFDQEHPTAMRLNEAAKATAITESDVVLRAMDELKSSAPAVAVSSSSAFGIFGEEFAGLVSGLFLLLIAVGDQAMIFALKWNRSAKCGTAPQSKPAPGNTAVTAPQSPHRTESMVHAAPQDLVLESGGQDEALEMYLAKVAELSDAGEPTGYRSVTKALGWPESRVRELSKRVRTRAEVR